MNSRSFLKTALAGLAALGLGRQAKQAEALPLQALVGPSPYRPILYPFGSSEPGDLIVDWRTEYAGKDPSEFVRSCGDGIMIYTRDGGHSWVELPCEETELECEQFNG